MQTLSRETRKELERTIKEARRTAEAGARKAIERLGVGDAKPPAGLNKAAQSLRNRLRAHGRQLGDRLHKSDKQDTRRLIEECAYEHWHRLLFARFLAENDLLIEPTTGVAITLSECQELAREQSEDWLRLASNFAQRMLPQIFRRDDPVLSVDLPPETRSDLEDYLKGLAAGTFKADDSLGWVYQFWQADRKEEVDAMLQSGGSAGADEIPAKTQLFTEDYMVLFLLHNTLGAWWAGKMLSKDVLESAKSEDELRRAIALPGLNWEYLRFVQLGRAPESSEENARAWRPAAGAFDGWPTISKGIKLLDPCMGSGHFLVFALPILVQMRIAEEGLLVADAVDAVMRDNLFGLEIDPRCTQIADFNLRLAAWKLAGYHELPMPHLACSGLGLAATEDEWLKLVEKHGMDRKTKVLAGDLIRETLRNLHKMFSQASTLGSLIDPDRAGAGMFKVDWDTLRPYFDTALAAEDDEVHERAVAAQGVVKAAELLAGEYTLVITNVPYLGRGKQDEVLKKHLKENYDEGRADLAAAFVMRCLDFCTKGGSAALVTPQNWLFLTSYKKLRELLLRLRTWNLVARLGPGAFETIGGHVVNVTLLTLSTTNPSQTSSMAGLDAQSAKEPVEKAANIRGDTAAEFAIIPQMEQLKNPDAVIKLEGFGQSVIVGEHAKCFAGILNGDSPKFRRVYWEFPVRPNEWVFQQSTVASTIDYGGREGLIFYDEENGHLREDANVRRKKLHDSDQRGNAA